MQLAAYQKGSLKQNAIQKEENVRTVAPVAFDIQA